MITKFITIFLYVSAVDTDTFGFFKRITPYSKFESNFSKTSPLPKHNWIPPFIKKGISDPKDDEFAFL